MCHLHSHWPTSSICTQKEAKRAWAGLGVPTAGNPEWRYTCTRRSFLNIWSTEFWETCIHGKRSPLGKSAVSAGCDAGFTHRLKTRRRVYCILSVEAPGETLTWRGVLIEFFQTWKVEDPMSQFWQNERANKRAVCFVIKIWTLVEDGWLWRRPNPMTSSPLLQISPVKLHVPIHLSWTEFVPSLSLRKPFDCCWESKHRLLGEEGRCHSIEQHMPCTAQFKSTRIETAKKSYFPSTCWHFTRSPFFLARPVRVSNETIRGRRGDLMASDACEALSEQVCRQIKV